MEETKVYEQEGKIYVSYGWQCLALFLLGILIGFLISPVKNGVSIGNNNHIVGNDDDDEVCGIGDDDTTEI
ncbi:MAG: hypothetical protein IJ740_09240 [Ruminococcus sp.]|nr:hypothetical protein [Ruminococcus sp.]